MKWAEGCRREFALNWKILFFYVYFFNMDISLILTLRCLKTSIHVTEVCLEGSLSFCFMVCRKRKFANITKNLRHASLDKNVFYTCLRDGICRSNMKRDIDVQ